LAERSIRALLASEEHRTFPPDGFCLADLYRHGAVTVPHPGSGMAAVIVLRAFEGILTGARRAIGSRSATDLHVGAAVLNLARLALLGLCYHQSGDWALS
jgi:hypothetical protein